jgi:hypothetical protein
VQGKQVVPKLGRIPEDRAGRRVDDGTGNDRYHVSEQWRLHVRLHPLGAVYFQRLQPCQTPPKNAKYWGIFHPNRGAASHCHLLGPLQALCGTQGSTGPGVPEAVEII